MSSHWVPTVLRLIADRAPHSSLITVYYSDIRNRGYLAKMHVLGNGEGLTSPSSSAPPSADAVAEANDIVAEEEARVAQQAQAGEIKREDAAAAV